jgi:hypothetical protein
VRVIGRAELLAADLFTHAEQTRMRLTFGDVLRHLAQLAAHPPTVRVGAANWCHGSVRGGSMRSPASGSVRCGHHGAWDALRRRKPQNFYLVRVRLHLCHRGFRLIPQVVALQPEKVVLIEHGQIDTKLGTKRNASDRTPLAAPESQSAAQSLAR